MPNWVDNKLTVTGPREEIDKLRDKPFLAETYVPIPEELRCTKRVGYSSPERYRFDPKGRSPEELRRDWENLEWIPLTESEVRRLEEQYGAADAWEWVLIHWGTKWDFDDVRIEEIEGGIVYLFNTAWSPPLPVLWVLTSLFPSLNFHLYYVDIQMPFEGVYEIQSREELRDDRWEPEFYGPDGEFLENAKLHGPEGDAP